MLLLGEALLQRSFIFNTNKIGSKGGLAACLLFLFFYIVAYQAVDAPSFIVASEVFPTIVRSKGIALTFFAYFVGAITYTTPSALAFKNIGWHMYLLYMALCAIAGIICYFVIPEVSFFFFFFFFFFR